MICENAQQNMILAQYGELPDELQFPLEQHIAGCEDCRREDPSTALDSSGDEMDLLANISDERAMANPARELERKQMGQAINEALDHLTPRERMVFELKHYQGLKLRTIGEMLSTTEETAKNTLFRATRKLRASLAEVR